MIDKDGVLKTVGRLVNSTYSKSVKGLLVDLQFERIIDATLSVKGSSFLDIAYPSDLLTSPGQIFHHSFEFSLIRNFPVGGCRLGEINGSIVNPSWLDFRSSYAGNSLMLISDGSYDVFCLTTASSWFSDFPHLAVSSDFNRIKFLANERLVALQREEDKRRREEEVLAKKAAKDASLQAAALPRTTAKST